MVAVEQYLKPELASQIKRLDLRAQMIVRGFLQGMHASPYHGFSVEFSEHRRYAHGDDPKLTSPRPYALGLKHKHLPEMMVHGGLNLKPLFQPILGNFYKGLSVSVPLPLSQLKAGASADFR